MNYGDPWLVLSPPSALPSFASPFSSRARSARPCEPDLAALCALVQLAGAQHHVPTNIVGKVLRESVVIAEVERKHLGGFDDHKPFAELPHERMTQASQDFDTSGRTIAPYLYLPLAHPKGVRLTLARISGKFSPRQLVMLDLRLDWQYLR
ncbi:uncharacterized protein BXZ73DRAFT_107446 [Epithele typhae]|uniref:uncharacterized protein n=1 Tax=Epithele typhae TaxID=378194 RepID=UPI002008AC66|nr:uncharacterized protein BXZ73DRAFT_107446 [Epithele typhae]KAH9912398.1 hypothetical protein BXZ73DRAFT_107446 [Epithele typhae]